VECGRERPGLGAVDDDLDEPERVVVVAQSALRLAGGHVVPGDPALVRRPLHHAGADNLAAGDGTVVP
jgi:hypothetical protein